MESEGKFVPEEEKEFREIIIGGKKVKIEKPKKSEIDQKAETEVEHDESIGETEIIPDPGWSENDEKPVNKQENKEK